MKSDDYTSLCERIRNHCRQKQWYGPDIYKDDSVFNQYPGGPWIRHDFHTSFFPLATEEQVRLSEEALGFPYPPLLRTLYLHVANGRVGPAYLHACNSRVYYFGEDYLFHQADSLEEWLERWLRGEDLEQVQ